MRVEVGDVARAEAVQCFGRESGDGDRHLLQGLFAFAGGDGDHVECLGLGVRRRRCADLREGHRRGEAAGDQGGVDGEAQAAAKHGSFPRLCGPRKGGARLSARRKSD